MQTKLRVLRLAVVASLLWISPTFSTAQRAQAQQKAKSLKVNYIGIASWYGEQHQGKLMANGEKFDRRKLTAASWYFPFGTRLRVVNTKNGESVVVTVTDRGPNFRLNRIIDLSEAAAERLSYRSDGLTTVFLYPLTAFDTKAARFDVDLFSTPLSAALRDLHVDLFSTPLSATLRDLAATALVARN